MPMTLMSRIERSAQQPDADPPPVTKPRQWIEGGQGRTWPVPLTMYR